MTYVLLEFNYSMKHYIYLLVVFFLFVPTLGAQKDPLDSLRNKLLTEKVDTNKVHILLEIGKQAYLTGSLDTSLKRLKQSLVLSEKINFKTGKAYALGMMGNVHMQTGNYPEAIKCVLFSLKIWEEQKNKKRMAISYNNLTVIYQDLHNDDEAIKNCYKTLELAKEIDDQTIEAACYNNLGNIFATNKEYKKALEYYGSSLKIKEEMGNKKGMANTYASMGIAYYELKDMEKALKFHLLSLDLRREIGDRFGVASSLINLASTYNFLKRVNESRKCLSEAFVIAREMQSKEVIYSAYAETTRLDSLTGNFKSAFFNYRLTNIYKDSLRNEETAIKSAREQMQFDFDKRTTADSVVFAKQKEIDDAQITAQNEEIKAKRNEQYFLFGGLALIFVFALFMYNRFKVTQKQKNIIQLQKTEVEEQKHIIEESKKDITDSINYALRIQNAILPPAHINNSMFEQSFILFKPKDIVSGDFYWYSNKNGKRIIAATDCTGHGVPGAFMSMLGITFLNEIVNERNITSPSEILGHLRDKVKSTLKQKGEEGESRDGMDIAIICLEENSRTLEFAGANNPLWICRKDNNEIKLIEIAPDKRPIGYFKGMGLPFTNNKFDLKKDDHIYIFTDGYADQFGGPKGKKFKYKQFQDLLISTSSKPIHEQMAILNSSFESWKGELEQVDDVCVIGIRI